MARTPGRRTDEPSDDAELADPEMTFTEVGMQLGQLAAQLLSVSKQIDDPKFRAAARQAEAVGEESLHDDLTRQAEERLQRTLMGMRSFRRDYDYWERVIAEFALRRGMTQRDAARLLGVSPATINRWAQHPVASDRE